MAVVAKRRRHIRAPCAFAAVCALTLAFAPAAANREASLDEYHLKAAFLINFARLVEWPESAFAEALAPLSVGLLSSTASSASLEKFLDGKTVGSRRVETRRIGSAGEAGGFHMIFVGASEGVNALAIASATRGEAVLLVGESPGFAKRGGMIGFFSENKKIRFEINPKAAEAAGLRLSSRLLRVATIVSGDR